MKSKTRLIRSKAEKEKMLKKMCHTCTKCDCVKPPRAHHCSFCGKCVLAMDHHCPWMKNCIGLYNMKAILLFNFYTMLTGLYSTIRAIVAIALCFAQDKTSLTCNNVSIELHSIKKKLIGRDWASTTQRVLEWVSRFFAWWRCLFFLQALCLSIKWWLILKRRAR